ncbi:hypothetical protein ABW19_dt0207199 [Dactylella cylindrospora]|nr:hypothetical protein ABW19_dt0207199 [Dactylella cylindrospora]
MNIPYVSNQGCQRELQRSRVLKCMRRVSKARVCISKRKKRVCKPSILQPAICNGSTVSTLSYSSDMQNALYRFEKNRIECIVQAGRIPTRSESGPLEGPLTRTHFMYADTTNREH